MFPSVRVCVPVREGVPQCESVCPSVVVCAQCVRVCPSLGGCVQCGKVWAVLINMYSTMVFLEKVLRYDYMPATGVADLEAALNSLLQSS